MCKICERRNLLEQERDRLIERDNAYHVELAKNSKDAVKTAIILLKIREGRKDIEAIETALTRMEAGTTITVKKAN